MILCQNAQSKIEAITLASEPPLLYTLHGLPLCTNDFNPYPTPHPGFAKNLLAIDLGCTCAFVF